jgi:hypothetical protein
MWIVLEYVKISNALYTIFSCNTYMALASSCMKHLLLFLVFAFLVHSASMKKEVCKMFCIHSASMKKECEIIMLWMS